LKNTDFSATFLVKLGGLKQCTHKLLALTLKCLPPKNFQALSKRSEWRTDDRQTQKQS
jgi:hypothetical protein